MDRNDRGVGEKRVKCGRLSGVLGPSTKHCDEGGGRLNSLRETHWAGEKYGSLWETRLIPRLGERREKT